jgi:hypothetical protein
MVNVHETLQEALAERDSARARAALAEEEIARLREQLRSIEQSR